MPKPQTSWRATVLILGTTGYLIYSVVSWVIAGMQGKDERLDAIQHALWLPIVLFLLSSPYWFASVVRKWMGYESKPKKPAKDDQSERILAAARNVIGQKAEVTVVRSKKDPTRYGLKYAGTGFVASKDENRLAVTDEVSALCGGRWQGEWKTTEDTVWLHELDNLPERAEHPGWEEDRPWWRVPVGVAAFGEMSFNFKKTAHILVCGLTGAGKTGFLHCILSALAESAAKGNIERLIVCDPKRVSVLEWEGRPGIPRVYTSPADLWEAPIVFAAEVQRRYEQHELWVRSGGTEGADKESHKPWLILIDEYEEFLTIMSEHAAEEVNGKPREKTLVSRPAEPVRAMERSARLAREAGMHIILLTQRGDANLMGGRVRNNFGGRVLLGRGGQEESKMCFGVGTYGRNVPAIPGRGTAQNGEGEPFEFQTYYVPKPTFQTEVSL